MTVEGDRQLGVVIDQLIIRPYGRILHGGERVHDARLEGVSKENTWNPKSVQIGESHFAEI